MKQTVINYAYVGDDMPSNYQFIGSSSATKEITPDILPMPNETGLYQCLDIGFGRGELGRILSLGHPHVIVDGIDAWEKTCNNPILRHYYRNVWHVNVMDLRPEFIKKYDYIFLMDVIEHFNPEDAVILIQWLLMYMKDTARLVVSTPLWFYPQGEVEPGDFEEHKCVAPLSSWLSLMPEFYNINPQDLVGMFVIGKKSLHLAHLFSASPNKDYTREMAETWIKQLGMKVDLRWHRS
jgi:hypothetical protein